MENIYEKILFIKNKPLFEQNISYETHQIFYKYTSNKYHKYIFNLLNTLCKRSPYENFVHVFHLSLCFIFKFLYQCENTQHLSNIDLVILNCFSLGIKSLTKQKLFPSINRLKKIYEEKYKTYNKKEIIEGEVICLKLLNYDINILTPFEYIEYITFDDHNISIKQMAIENLENIILNKLESFLYKTPFDIAKECINEATNKVIIREPKIITKKIIKTKTFIGKNFLKNNSSSNNLINSKDENKKLNNNREIFEKIKRTNNASNSKYKQNVYISNIKLNLKFSPERIYYKKNCNYNIINHAGSSDSIIADDNFENSKNHKTKIFKKKINKNSVSKNKYIFKSKVMNINNRNNEICQKRLCLNRNNKNKKFNRDYYEKVTLNMSNIQFFRKTNNFNISKENDKNYQNIIQRNNSGNNCINCKYSVESENVNNYKNNTKKSKYEIETRNIKLGYLNKKYLYNSDNKKDNNGNITNQKHSQLNSSGNFYDNLSRSNVENVFDSKSIDNYYIKW